MKETIDKFVELAAKYKQEVVMPGYANHVVLKDDSLNRSIWMNQHKLYFRNVEVDFQEGGYITFPTTFDHNDLDEVYLEALNFYTDYILGEYRETKEQRIADRIEQLKQQLKELEG